MRLLSRKEKNMSEGVPEQIPPPPPKTEQAAPSPEAAKATPKEPEPINNTGPEEAIDIETAAEKPGAETTELLADVADGSAFDNQDTQSVQPPEDVNKVVAQTDKVAEVLDKAGKKTAETVMNKVDQMADAAKNSMNENAASENPQQADVHGNLEQTDHPVSSAAERLAQEASDFLQQAAEKPPTTSQPGTQMPEKPATTTPEVTSVADKLGNEAAAFLNDPNKGKAGAPKELSHEQRAAQAPTDSDTSPSVSTEGQPLTLSNYPLGGEHKGKQPETSPEDTPEEKPEETVAEAVANAVTDTIAETKQLSEKEEAAIQQSIDVGNLSYDLTNLVGPDQAKALTAQAAKNPDLIPELKNLAEEAKYDSVKQARLVEASKAVIENAATTTQELPNQQLLENMGENGRKLAEIGVPADKANEIITLIAKYPDLVVNVTQTMQTIPLHPSAEYVAGQQYALQHELKALQNVDAPSDEQKTRSRLAKALLAIFVVLGFIVGSAAEGAGSAVKDAVKK